MTLPFCGSRSTHLDPHCFCTQTSHQTLGYFPWFISSVDYSTATLKPVLVLQRGFQAMPPMSLEKKSHFPFSTDLDLSFLGIFLMTHIIRFRFRGFLS